jgi:hypothetical protein
MNHLVILNTMQNTPILHCCETWHSLASTGTILPNHPTQPETWAAIEQLQINLLTPLEQQFGPLQLSYGFAGPELIRAVRRRAEAGGWLPNIHPPGDQHAGHELNSKGTRICKRDGIAVDLKILGVSSLAVVDWLRQNALFDRIYYYGPDRPFHLSWAEKPIGQVVEMVPYGKRLVPKVIVKGKP